MTSPNLSYQERNEHPRIYIHVNFGKFRILHYTPGFKKVYSLGYSDFNGVISYFFPRMTTASVFSFSSRSSTVPVSILLFKSPVKSGAYSFLLALILITEFS